MKLSELNEIIAQLIKYGHGDKSLVITLQEPSIGARAGCGIRYVTTGFDWEAGQIRITPDIPLTSFAKDRDTKLHPRKKNYKGTNRIIRECPKCECKLTKDMRYCPMCGQHVYTDLEERKEEKNMKEGG